MKYTVVNLGCKVNRVESDAFASSLDAHGAKSCDAADADLIVVNTCAVTGEGEKKPRKAVGGALRARARHRHRVRRRHRHGHLPRNGPSRARHGESRACILD